MSRLMLYKYFKSLHCLMFMITDILITQLYVNKQDSFTNHAIQSLHRITFMATSVLLGYLNK